MCSSDLNVSGKTAIAPEHGYLRPRPRAASSIDPGIRGTIPAVRRFMCNSLCSLPVLRLPGMQGAALDTRPASRGRAADSCARRRNLTGVGVRLSYARLLMFAQLITAKLLKTEGNPPKDVCLHRIRHARFEGSRCGTCERRAAHVSRTFSRAAKGRLQGS